MNNMVTEKKISQRELATLFPDGIPIAVMKLIFPEKSEPMTVSEIRYFLHSVAALSTDAEPVVQCCMCGKKGLSTKEGDGGTECELSDGRWVCSSDCWGKAIDPAPSVAVTAVIDLIREYGNDSLPGSEYRLACNDLIEAFTEPRHSALSAQVQDVAGMKLMPHEPTQEMLDAATRADQDGFSASMKTIWMIMWGTFAAAPPTNQKEPK